MSLSKGDQKLLNRLQVPQTQKVLLERYWQANPGSEINLSIKALLFAIRPAIIVALASPYFISESKPLANIASVLLWLLIPSMLLCNVGILLIFATYEASEKNKDKAMSQLFALFLPGANGTISKWYSALCNIVIFALTAADGYFITALMIAICYLGSLFLSAVLKRAIASSLKEKAREAFPEDSAPIVEARAR